MADPMFTGTVSAGIRTSANTADPSPAKDARSLSASKGPVCAAVLGTIAATTIETTTQKATARKHRPQPSWSLFGLLPEGRAGGMSVLVDLRLINLRVPTLRPYDGARQETSLPRACVPLPDVGDYSGCLRMAIRPHASAKAGALQTRIARSNVHPLKHLFLSVCRRVTPGVSKLASSLLHRPVYPTLSLAFV